MMSRSVLVLNSGSSSVKFQLIDPDSGASLADGIVERIGEDASAASLTLGEMDLTRGDRVADHEAALRTTFELFDEAGAHLNTVGLVAVGHRVVHGGPDLYRPTLVDDALVSKLEELAPLAPLHNPPAVLGIRVALKALPDLPHVAVFDTAFFHNLPPAAATYAIDRDIAERWHIRRYGFHGTSHQYVSEQVAAFLDVPLAKLSQIVLHLGNGASASAIVGGRPVDTSMGLTPMEGLVMGTRSGDIDPGVVAWLAHAEGMTADEFHVMVNSKSGLLGVSETSSDVRDLLERESSDVRAAEAIALFCYQAKKWIGALAAVLGGLDTLVFAGGIGENSAVIRERICDGLGFLGIELDPARNTAAAAIITTPSSPATARIIRTDEELYIATKVAQLLAT